MGLRINTNISAQYALANLTNTNNKLSESLNRLSTGLRINKAADDSAGMTIADGLKFQSTNLGQAIKNGNNGINLIQIADMALQKSIDIVDQISQKAAQAANDTQDPDSRSALQSDIDKLLEEIDNISNTTSYKGTKLLDGSFTNKLLHVGAYTNQTLSISVNKTASTAIGKLAQVEGDDGEYANSLSGATALTFDTTANLNKINAGLLTINGIDVNNYIDKSASTSQLDAKQMADAINQIQGTTGVTAKATTTLIGTAALGAGSINKGQLKINGVDIGATSNGTIVEDINNLSDKTGVIASIDSQNRLVLTAADGRNIAVEEGAGVSAITKIADNRTSLTGANLSLGSFGAQHSFYMNGVKITYGGTSTAASAATQIRTALANAGVTDITVTSGASIASFTFTINDGHDLNTYNSGASIASHIANSSAHGVISLISQKTIDIGGDKPQIGGFSTSSNPPKGSLSMVNVTSQNGAEIAIARSKSALSDLDKIRSGLGSVQNQIKATVENITTTQININSAESTIRDVDFANESSNFSKLQILAQSGTYALAQSNAVQQNVLRLLQ